MYLPVPPVKRYEWGWKTRPHFFNDAAVRITNPANSAGPVNTTTYISGNPIEYPPYTPWDLSFDILTDREGRPGFP